MHRSGHQRSVSRKCHELEASRAFQGRLTSHTSGSPGALAVPVLPFAAGGDVGVAAPPRTSFAPLPPGLHRRLPRVLVGSGELESKKGQAGAGPSRSLISSSAKPMGHLLRTLPAWHGETAADRAVPTSSVHTRAPASAAHGRPGSLRGRGRGLLDGILQGTAAQGTGVGGRACPWSGLGVLWGGARKTFSL